MDGAVRASRPAAGSSASTSQTPPTSSDTPAPAPTNIRQCFRSAGGERAGTLHAAAAAPSGFAGAGVVEQARPVVFGRQSARRLRGGGGAAIGVARGTAGRQSSRDAARPRGGRTVGGGRAVTAIVGRSTTVDPAEPRPFRHGLPARTAGRTGGISAGGGGAGGDRVHGASAATTSAGVW